MRALDFCEGLKQILIIDSDVLDLILPEGFEKMVIMERDIKSLGGLSQEKSAPIIMMNALARNIDDGRGMALLDGVFGRLANETKIELLARLSHFGLEQIIVFESFAFEKGLLEEHESNIVELPYQHLAGD